MGIYTAQFNYRGVDGIDITIRSRDPVGMMFSPPSWDIINDVKRAQATFDDKLIKEAERRYIHAYNYQLDSRRRQAQHYFDSFAARCRSNHFTFRCFCGPRDFCHRHLAAFWMWSNYSVPILGEKHLY